MVQRHARGRSRAGCRRCCCVRPAPCRPLLDIVAATAAPTPATAIASTRRRARSISDALHGDSFVTSNFPGSTVETPGRIPGSVRTVASVIVESPTLGEGWLRTSRAILETGALERYDGQPTRELAHLTLVVERPSPDDPVIAELGDPEWLAWMHENFFVRRTSRSSATPRATRFGCSTTRVPAATRSRGSSSACAPTRNAARRR